LNQKLYTHNAEKIKNLTENYIEKYLFIVRFYHQSKA